MPGGVHLAWLTILLPEAAAARSPLFCASQSSGTQLIACKMAPMDVCSRQSPKVGN